MKAQQRLRLAQAVAALIIAGVVVLTIVRSVQRNGGAGTGIIVGGILLVLGVLWMMGGAD